jgi:hypothetical protein
MRLRPLRDLASRAPEIANELRRLADDLDEEAKRGNRPRKDDAAD